jgi:ABC-2 type transport system ATP-binding protein
MVKRYGPSTAVDGLSLTARRGEVTAILGPNGAGKTTTVEVCEGYRRADGGTVRVLGLDPVRDAVALKPRVGVMLQAGGIPPAVPAGEYLRTLSRFHVKPHDAAWLLDIVGLTAHAKTPYKRLSGGQQQRLSLAAAVLGRPELVFLDEPTAGMDPQARHATWVLVSALKADGVSVILTTHFMEEAERLCNRLVIIDRGRIIAAGAPRELVGRHIERHVVEVHGDGTDAWTGRSGRALASRIERAGDTVFCYATDDTPLLASLEHEPELRYLHRPANLEDVFLKLTGRELRD